MDAEKKIVLDFIKRHALGVIATTSTAGEPQAALIGFAQTDQLELIFETSVQYRKYTNITQHAKVAVVIGWDEKITVQYEGHAHELTPAELPQYQQILFEKIPNAAARAKRPEARYFKITPTWIRYSDLSVDPWNVFEITL